MRILRARTVWAVVAILLSTISLGVELSSHLCAGALFDPLPDTTAIAAYVFLPLALALTEHVLRSCDGFESAGILDPSSRIRPWNRERRALRLALFANGAGLAVSAAFAVLFFPVLPISLIAVWLSFGSMGVGLAGFCAWSPLLNFLVFIVQWRPLIGRWRELDGSTTKWPLYMWGLGVTCAAFLVAGRPAAIGYFFQRAANERDNRESAVGWLRLLGAEDDLLQLCYRNSSPPWLGLGQTLARTGSESDSVESARKVYYLVTGRPFETADASRFLGRAGIGRFDVRDPVAEDQGGELVGRSVSGLSLAASRIDGVLDPRTETSFTEWTLTFRNSSSNPQEARAEILLPEGGIVDKVSLWINDEERPAAFGPRSLVRRAYEEVAIAEQRDPLLVTARTEGRVLTQCFPVPPRREMRIRLGMSAPLLWRRGASAQLTYTPPSIQHANFALPATLRHELWLEGHWPERLGHLEGPWTRSVGAAAPGSDAAEIVHTARLTLTGDEILRPPLLSISGGPLPRTGDRLGASFIRTESPLNPPVRPIDLLILVDTTRGMSRVIDPERLAGALSRLSAGSRVRLVDTRAAARGDRQPGTRWLPVEKVGPELRRWLSGRTWLGGVEAGASLERAFSEVMSRRVPGAVLWLHGATPPDCAEAPALLQAIERRPLGPALIGLQLQPGPDTLMERVAGHSRVFARASRTGVDDFGEAVDLAAKATWSGSAGAVPLGGRLPAINGLCIVGGSVAAVAPTRRQSPAERLAVASTVLQPWLAGRRTGSAIAAAQRLAIQHRLVTPLSGAVVLETKADYQRHGLDDSASEDAIPSVPEPAAVTMLGIGVLLAAIYLRRSRPATVREAG